MKTTTKFSLDIWERTVRLVREHEGEYESQWPAIGSVDNALAETIHGRYKAEVIYRRSGKNFETVELGYPDLGGRVQPP